MFLGSAIDNTSGANYSSLYLNASGVSAQIYTGKSVAVFGTNITHSISIQSDWFNSSPAGITVSASNDVTIGKSLAVNAGTNMPIYVFEV